MTDVSEYEALEIAKREFIRQGKKLEDYRVTIEAETGMPLWTIWLDAKQGNTGVSGRDVVKVERDTGRMYFVPGARL